MSSDRTPREEALDPTEESSSNAEAAHALSVLLGYSEDQAEVASARRGLRPSALALARLLVGLVAVVWLWLGAASIIQPVEVAALVDQSLSSPTARFEFRAMYGGMSIAIGLLHLFALFRRSWLQPMLLVGAALLGGLVAGRIVSLVVDDPPAPIALVFLAGEGLFFLAMFYAAYRLRKASRVAADES